MKLRLGDVLFLVSTLSFALVSALGSDLNYLKAFDDSIIYSLSWEKEQVNLMMAEPLESVTMFTSNKEKYSCYLPKLSEGKKEEVVAYNGPNALQLLAPLFSQVSCSYRLEAFWTYELCHGHYVRQYHEERDGKKIKLQEYFLGRWDKDKTDAQSKEIDEEIKTDGHREIPVRKIEGLSLPYLLVTMDSGTLCDLNGKMRTTRIYYVCYPAGKHEIFSLEEASTCEYEIVVLTPLLCQHPDYRAKESGENKIKCWPEEGAPHKPKALTDLESESIVLRQQRLLETYGLADTKFKVEFRQIEDTETPGQKQTIAFITSPTGKPAPPVNPVDGSSVEDQSQSAQQREVQHDPLVQPPDQSQPSPATPMSSVYDPKLVEDFLAGEYCLHGGTGWWKHEFCYGKLVQQYHDSKDTGRATILLGVFDAVRHIAWLEKNPNKRPKAASLRKQVSHFYDGGSHCEITDLPRQVEVKLKCKELDETDQKQTMNALTLYLLEPNPCNYILGMEAPFLCPLIESADENGLFTFDPSSVHKVEHADSIIKVNEAP